MEPSRHSARTYLACCVGLLAVLALGGLWYATDDGQQANRAHDKALALWQSSGPTLYSFDYSHCGGFCALCQERVTVRDGEVVRTVTTGPGCWGPAPTIEEIFAMEERDRSDPEWDSFTVTYDPQWGFPASVELRCPSGTSDCGTGYSVTDFRVGG